MAAKMAFQMFSGVTYEPHSAMRFLTYTADAMPLKFPEANLVIGVSASGGSTRVVQSLEKAREVNADLLTMGLVGNPDSKVAGAADLAFSAQIPDFGRSPGIRTYLASLMGLYALAIRLGEAHGRLSAAEARTRREAILAAADVADVTLAACKEPARAAAEALQDKEMFSFVGSGPSFATAYFSSAKVVEAAGVFSTAQDLEEWVHIEHHAYPTDYPMVMVAPPGRSYDRAAKLAYLATLLGHPLVAVAHADDADVKAHADHFLPAAGEVEEVYSPLIYHIPANYFACFLAQARGRMPFMQDNEEVRKRINAFSSQIRDAE
jgi:glucosamine--fructose-6-phosphate aminotransferase (isomerizing)